MGEDEQKDKNEFYFDRKNYFLRFNGTPIELSNKTISKSLRHGLEYFVDDLRRNRTKTIDRFISEPKIDEMFRSIAQLLLCSDDRICGDCAYILGSIVEIERGLQSFLSAFSSTTNSVDIIRFLSQLLTHHDTECVLNAAGTLGTICGSKEGRDLLIHHICITQVINNVSMLLSSENGWIASNAALVLARITVEDLGCQTILSHPKHREILNCLLSALDLKDNSRSTNIAFAIARLIESEEGKRSVIDDCGQEKFFQALLVMLEVNESKDMHKNACYTLSSFCTSEFGFELCIHSLTIFNRILIAIERILSSKEHETVWFALMCLRTIAKYDGSSEYLCSSGHLLDVIRQIQTKWTESKQIQDEAKLLWFMIHRGVRPGRPNVDDCRDTSVDLSWSPCSYQRDETPVQYRILLNENAAGLTDETHLTLNDLKMNTSYSVRIQFITSEGESATSDPTFFHTQDQVPPSIINLHVARATMNALRIVWELLDPNSGTNIKGYQIYLNNSEYEITNECGTTISSLLPNTEYQIDVCTVLIKGHGPRSSMRTKTSTAGDSTPLPPIFTVVGRRELHIKWQAPEVIAGRLTRYDLLCNERCIYSGTDQEYHASMLKPDTEYTIEVVAITNEGRFRSRPAKTRTLKDEFHPPRHALYESNRNKRVETMPLKPKLSTTEKSINKEIRTVPPSFLPNQNIQITTVRAVHFKTENSSPRVGLPGVYKGTTVRPIRTHHRFRTETKSFTQPRISASVIIPTLDIDHPRDLAWPTRIKAYRYPL